MAVSKTTMYTDLTPLLRSHELHAACKFCCKRKAEITFCLVEQSHHCQRDILLARQIGTHHWRPINPLPEFPRPMTYEVCWNFKEGSGCTSHGKRCSFARSSEEASVWNFMKVSVPDIRALINMLEHGTKPPVQSHDPTGGTERILSKFLGKFLELCKTCFHSSPQRISRKQNGENPPSCTSKHPWKPLLIHCKETPQKGAEYHEIRQLPNKPFSEWRYCRYVSNGEPCWHGANRCWFAHSEVEMAVWTEESKGQFHRSRLLGNDVQKTQRPTANSTPPVKQQTRSPRTAELYCKVCRCKFRTQEDYMNHCFTSEHRQRIFGDGCSKGKHRDPPQTYHTFKMCQRPYNCEFGDRCLEAHSEEELQEWRSRARAARKKASGAEDQGLLSYQDRLLEEYRTSSNPEHILSETVSGVKITCDPDLFNVQHVKKENVPLKWKFTVESENALAEIALLKQEPGASFTLGENSNEHWTYSTGVWYRSSHSESTYEVTVSFISTCPGVYEQWLVFDFDTRPVLLQKILVRVGMPSSTHQTISEQWPVSKDPVPPNLRLWNRGNRVIVPYFIQPEADLKLLKEFEPPAMNRQYYQLMEDCDSINHRNYKERMHSFLYQEEQAEEEIVCRLNIHSTVTLSSTLIDVRYGLKIACDGELFGSLSVCHVLTPDTPEGFMLKRWVQSVLVGEITANDQNQKVYEALILKDTSSVKEIHLKLSRECCSDLGLQKGQTREMEVQFQLNRVWFCEMHKAIDLLPDLQYVLPDFNKTCVPVHPTKYPLLNEKQQAAMGFILGKSDGKHSVAPLLIYGPFGTGKTFTLATAAVKLMKEEHNRVLICTHTNSSADLYVKDHFYKHIQEGNLTINPLRIKAKEVSLRSTDPVTMNYCLLTEDGWYFKFPDKDTLDLRRIVITTTGVARLLHDLKLPENYFSHIMIDEASQMLECEALMALSLAGPKTRVVLAGDHMQMGPKLFSVEDHKRSDHTLLNRLFYYYQSERKNVASESRVIFNENYRSTKGIVDFVSTYFYFDKCQKKQQTAHGIKSSGDVAAHPRMHPLVFSHVRGECHLDTTTMSWYNPEEIAVVVEIVKQLLQSWPVEKWKEPDPSAICILSQGAQVYHLRNTLKQVNLHRVTVENAENVQGKQFRVIIIVTVHTRDTIKPSASNCLEFFNDARVLNTAMTRAQSQVIIVGDVAALCYFGKCAKTWRCYVEHCIENNSAKPEHLTKDFLNQEVMEVSRFVPTQEEDTSDTDSTTSEMADIDPILKELLDESIDLKVNVTEEGLLDIFKNYHPVRTPDDCEEEYHRDQSDSIFLSGEGNEIPSIPKTNAVHKRCTIVMERYDSAYAIPLDEPTSRINITGRKNVRCCFPDDEVLVEVLNDEITPPTGRVHSARAGKDYRPANKLFICTIEKNDNQVMTPINKCISKIYTPFWKDKPHHIAVRKPDDFRPQRFVKITEDSKRNHLFVVQVLKWRENFRYPLGIVVEVLPKVTSLEAGLDVLHIEHELQKSPSLTEQELQRVRECSQDLDGRKDFRNIITFTIDPSHSRDHDDAISVRDLGLHYEIGIHIADVAHFVPMGSQLDEYAKQQGLVFYPPETTPVYIFPRELSEGLFSLLPGCDRHTISLMVVIEKATDLIKSTDFHLSVIHSDRKLSYGEAEQILQNSSVLCFNTVEGCLRIASHFSKIHRKNRKQGDWCYKSPDEDSLIGSRQSHRVVEELMILFNNSVAQLLLKQEETKSSVPLRCQDRPDLTLLGQLRQRCRAWLPMSIHLSHLMEVEGGLMSLPEAGRTGTQQQHDTDSTAFPRFTNVEPDTFSVLTSLLENLQTAANEGDIQRVVDLITTDDVHPQLLPIIRAFRKLIRRAHVIRSNSSLTSRVGHFDLDLDCYSWASSPIRRYVDIITHRILHSVLEGKEITYSPIEIDRACVSFSLQYNKESKYERTSHSLNLASKLKEKSARKIAYITDVPPNGNNFRLSFPLLRQSICDDVTIMYRDLQLANQPAYDRQQNCCIIKWIRRVYSFLQDDIHFELKRQVPNSLITQVSREAWEGLLSTIREEKWGNIQERVKDITSEVRQERTFSCGEPRESRNAEGHFVELSLRIKQGGTIEVQLGTDTARGMLVPAIQLLIVNPNFEICLEHTKNPVECFSKYALRASKDVYPTYNDYQNIWTSLCEMESACNAVSENESIVLEDVELTWTQERGQNLQGFFWLPLEKKKKWAIECDLRKCLLCVRMRQPNNDFQPEKKQDNTLTEAKYLDLTSMTNVIWIAHGVTTEVEEKEEDKDDTSMKIHFCINHLPMTNTPQRIFLESTRFTVELIPKLLPDVRKEETIKRLTKANKLVKCITLGKKIDLEGIKITANGSGTFDMPQHHALGFPPLNRSQTKAIRETLHNHFTLIQGPPGTGKTVVGVHIVYWFFMQSKKEVPRSNKKDRTEEPKKGCILYCGPSNKSVDVVAGQLLKLSKRGVLRPLRVYSEQMEVLEYPYPGSSLKLSRHSLREGKPNQELRSITLHHRMRMPENPHSSTIRAFDVRIRRGDDLSDEEIKSYKRALQSARKHELLRHDVILCTCTAASNPNFTKAKLNPQQIIIDECAMATEPEALIPLITHQPEQIVLIGDHKQLKPVVSSEVVERLGMGKSLFERYMRKALMLDIQYRMHEDICEFPSQQFYGGHLKTGRRPNAKPSVLLTKSENPTAILFGHVEGKEVSLIVATEKGNENSRANIEEAEQTVRLATLLIYQSGIDEEQIAILTPYNAQVAKIKEILSMKGIYNVTVSTIMKSQGSEWRYVILSTVRSCPESEIDNEPTKSWLMKKLGFVMDPNQVNVGITRAQEGLCIIGNQTLLRCSHLWRKLLNHYYEKECVVNPAQRIHVQKKQGGSKNKVTNFTRLKK